MPMTAARHLRQAADELLNVVHSPIREIALNLRGLASELEAAGPGGSASNGTPAPRPSLLASVKTNSSLLRRGAGKPRAGGG